VHLFPFFPPLVHILALPRRQQLGFAAALAATGVLGLYLSDYLEYSFPAKADSGEQRKDG
jgi:hypothetical protein